MGTQYIFYGYFPPGGIVTIPAFDRLNLNKSFVTKHAPGRTFEGQLSSGVLSMALVMLSCIYQAFRDASGKAILFPIKVAKVMKDAAPYVLQKGKIKVVGDGVYPSGNMAFQAKEQRARISLAGRVSHLLRRSSN